MICVFWPFERTCEHVRLVTLENEEEEEEEEAQRGTGTDINDVDEHCAHVIWKRCVCIFQENFSHENSVHMVRYHLVAKRRDWIALVELDLIELQNGQRIKHRVKDEESNGRVHCETLDYFKR